MNASCHNEKNGLTLPSVVQAKSVNTQRSVSTFTKRAIKNSIGLDKSYWQKKYIS